MDFIKLITKNLGETFGAVALIIGAIIASGNDSAFSAYAGAAIAGVMLGAKLLSSRKTGTTSYWYLIILGFLAGFVAAAVWYASVKTIILSFAAGLLTGFLMKKQGIC